MLRPEKEKKSKVMIELENNRLPIVEACKVQTQTVTVGKKEKVIEQGPCTRIMKGCCHPYQNPTAKWKNGNCPLATHLIQVEDVKKFVNPIKASKRG